jgi:hypothetical protein
METIERKGHGEKLSRFKEQAIAALLTSPTIKEAAAKAGVAESTVRRWLRDPVFWQAYAEEREHQLRAAVGELNEATTEALVILRAEARRPSNDPKTRVAAAKTILDIYLKEMARYDTERRLSGLERKMAGEQERNAEQATEESLGNGDGAEESGADRAEGVPEHGAFDSEASISISSSQVNADGGEKKGDGNDPNHARITDGGPGNGAKAPILKRTRVQQPEVGQPVTSPIMTGPTTPPTQMNADECQEHESKKRQAEELWNRQCVTEAVLKNIGHRRG